MIVLHQIGALHEARHNPNFNTLGQVVTAEGPVSFDGVYESVYNNYQALGALKGRVTFFVSGMYVGGDNAFDVPNNQPLSHFCTVAQILEMAEFLDAKIGYHGWAHKRCVGTDWDELVIEMRPPPWLLKSHFFNWSFAWPHGEYGTEAIRIAKALGYREAWSNHTGDGSDYAKIRHGLGRD